MRLHSTWMAYTVSMSGISSYIVSTISVVHVQKGQCRWHTTSLSLDSSQKLGARNCCSAFSNGMAVLERERILRHHLEALQSHRVFGLQSLQRVLARLALQRNLALLDAVTPSSRSPSPPEVSPLSSDPARLRSSGLFRPIPELKWAQVIGVDGSMLATALQEANKQDTVGHVQPFTACNPFDGLSSGHTDPAAGVNRDACVATAYWDQLAICRYLDELASCRQELAAAQESIAAFATRLEDNQSLVSSLVAEVCTSVWKGQLLGKHSARHST